MEKGLIFFSYARENSDFVLKLAKDLRANKIPIWIDQLDIKPGTRWDISVERALKQSQTLLLVLSPSSVSSSNVMDEVSYALEKNNRVIPVMFKECETPFRLKRLQFIDFTVDYEIGLRSLLKTFETNLPDFNLSSEVRLKEIDIVTSDAQKEEITDEKTKLEPVQKEDSKVSNSKGKSKLPLIIVIISIVSISAFIYWFYFWPLQETDMASLNPTRDTVRLKSNDIIPFEDSSINENIGELKVDSNLDKNTYSIERSEPRNKYNPPAEYENQDYNREKYISNNEKKENKTLPKPENEIKKPTVIKQEEKTIEKSNANSESVKKKNIEDDNFRTKSAGTFIDKRNSDNYKWVKMGDQIWMAENLNLGIMIDVDTEPGKNNIIEKYCYNNDEALCDEFGGLYYWEEIFENSNGDKKQGICPPGWHIPSREEWNRLIHNTESLYLSKLGYPSNKLKYETSFEGKHASYALKSRSRWKVKAAGNDSFGFNVLPAGHRGYNPNNYAKLGETTNFWTSTEHKKNEAYSRIRTFGSRKAVSDEYGFKKHGMSLRCLKDNSK